MARNKFGAVPTIVDGVRFASQAEAQRYRELKILRNRGVIEALDLQPRYPIIVNGFKVCTYVGDFRYKVPFESGSWQVVVEDVKGIETPVFKLKKKLMLAVCGIDVKTVTAGRRR